MPALVPPVSVLLPPPLLVILLSELPPPLLLFVLLLPLFEEFESPGREVESGLRESAVRESAVRESPLLRLLLGEPEFCERLDPEPRPELSL